MLNCWNLLYCRSWNSPHLPWGANTPPSQADAGCEGGCLSVHQCLLLWWDLPVPLWRVIFFWLFPQGTSAWPTSFFRHLDFFSPHMPEINVVFVQTPANGVSVPSVSLPALHLLPTLQDRRHRGCPAPFYSKPDLLLKHNSAVGI